MSVQTRLPEWGGPIAGGGGSDAPSCSSSGWDRVQLGVELRQQMCSSRCPAAGRGSRARQVKGRGGWAGRAGSGPQDRGLRLQAPGPRPQDPGQGAKDAGPGPRTKDRGLKMQDLGPGRRQEVVHGTPFLSRPGEPMQSRKA